VDIPGVAHGSWWRPLQGWLCPCSLLLSVGRANERPEEPSLLPRCTLRLSIHGMAAATEALVEHWSRLARPWYLGAAAWQVSRRRTWAASTHHCDIGHHLVLGSTHYSRYHSACTRAVREAAFHYYLMDEAIITSLATTAITCGVAMAPGPHWHPSSRPGSPGACLLGTCYGAPPCPSHLLPGAGSKPSRSQA
jgi:hypothetical protein